MTPNSPTMDFFSKMLLLQSVSWKKKKCLARLSLCAPVALMSAMTTSSSRKVSFLLWGSGAQPGLLCDGVSCPRSRFRLLPSAADAGESVCTLWIGSPSLGGEKHRSSARIGSDPYQIWLRGPTWLFGLGKWFLGHQEPWFSKCRSWSCNSSSWELRKCRFGPHPRISESETGCRATCVWMRAPGDDSDEAIFWGLLA